MASPRLAPTGRPAKPHSIARMVAVTAMIVAAEYLAVELLLSRLTRVSYGVDVAVEATTLALTTAAALWVMVIGPLRREAEAERRISRDREAAMAAEAKRQDFEASLHRALEMADTEQAVYHTTAKAIAHGTPGLEAEMLLADSSGAHLARAVTAGGEARRARCGVATPRECPAIRRAQTLTFASSDDLESCPHLEDREGGACSAVCVPVSVGGRSIGVLHAVADLVAPPTTAAVSALEAVAAATGSRLGMLRVMEAIHLQAATDPLTGLMNRRSFENDAQDLIRRGVPFTLAMGDLDHFKRLNDTHGHDAGDRALRAFAQSLRGSLRSDDLVCRYGGEEFVIIFPHRPVADAAAALRRVQHELLVTVGTGTVAAFTVSFGLAEAHPDQDLEHVCRVADAALYRAKREGRNRVVIDGVYDVQGIDAVIDGIERIHGIDGIERINGSDGIDRIEPGPVRDAAVSEALRAPA